MPSLHQPPARPASSLCAMKETDKILDDEYGKDFGNELVGIGARIAARFMPNNTFEASVELDMSADRALAELESAAGHIGRVIGRKVSDGGIRLTGLIKAGFLNLAPAVVDIYITPLGDERCQVRITGTAKEGLIKQRAGEGAVRRLLAATSFGSVSIAK